MDKLCPSRYNLECCKQPGRFFQRFVFVHMYAPQTNRCLWKPEEDFNTPETATTGGCKLKLPDAGAGNQIWVLCKSIKCA